MSNFAEQKSATPASTQISTSTSSSSSSSSTSSSSDQSNYRLPSDISLKHVAKLGIVEDKPIMLDYWTASLDKNALIGVKESGEKLLVKSSEEYTSPIAKFYKSGTEYIIITENSIYLVSSDIPSRKIS